MYNIVAAAGKTGEFVSFDGWKQIRIRDVDRTLFEGSGAQMAVQAFPVVIRFIETNGVVGLAEILHIDVVQPIQFGAEPAKHRIVRVAGVASLIGRYAVILKVRGGEVIGVIDEQAATVGRHCVTGKAELGAGGPLKLRRNAHGHAQGWQQEQDKKGQHLATLGRGQTGSRHQNTNQQRAKSDQGNQ